MCRSLSNICDAYCSLANWFLLYYVPPNHWFANDFLYRYLREAQVCHTHPRICVVQTEGRRCSVDPRAFCTSPIIALKRYEERDCQM